MLDSHDHGLTRRNQSTTSLNLDLRRIVYDSLRCSPEHGDFPSHANVLSAVARFWITKLCAITAPNDDREDLIRVGLV